MVLSKKQFFFQELTHYGFYCDFRVYIFGVDVTEQVVESSLDWTYADRTGENTANFTLQNAEDNFVLTAQNLGLNPTTLKSSGKSTFRDPKSTAITGNFLYTEQPKKQIYDRKAEVNKGVSGPDKYVYSLGYRNLVVQKHDTVRIFYQNPISLTQWLPAFTGYVDNVSRDKDYTTGQSTLRISCFCIRGLLKRMRVQKSPTHGKDVAYEILNDSEGFFKDFINPTNYSNVLGKSSFEEAMNKLILGEKSIKNSGVGRMTKGDEYFYDPSDSVPAGSVKSYVSSTEDPYGKGGLEIPAFNTDILQHWYNLLLCGEYDGKVQPLSIYDVKKIGEDSHPDGEHAPDAQKMYMLMPKGGLRTRELLKTHFSEGTETRDFEDRFSLISTFCETIDYQWWVTAMGDIVFEFAMYEFLPSDFNYSNLMEIDHYVKSDDLADEEGDIATVLTVTGGMSSEDIEKAQANIRAALVPRILITSPNLSARLGVKNEEHQIPVTTNKRALALLGHIEFFKRLTNAGKMSVQFAYRPWLLPNKPIYHKTEDRLGITSSVTNRLNLFADASTDVTLKYVRRRDQNGNFAFIDGAPSVLTSYREAWANKDGTHVENIGAVVIDVSTEGTTIGTTNIGF